VKNLDPDYMQQNMKAIVSFEIEVIELKHVFKLSQNRDDVSHENIKKELSNGTPACKHMAAAMKR
jgi:transcriptional regulator